LVSANAEIPISNPVRTVSHWRQALARIAAPGPFRAFAALLVTAVLLAAVGYRIAEMREEVNGGQTPAAQVKVMPTAPVDGLLTLVIPSGAAAKQQAGGPGYEMPSVISLRVGDKILIRNDDDAPHMILYAFLLPGESDERTFVAPGSEVYSSGCGLHAASYHNFTTIFVSED
jgi:hypothetical protein